MAQWDGCDAKSSAGIDIIEEAYCQNNANGTHHSTSIPQEESKAVVDYPEVSFRVVGTSID